MKKKKTIKIANKLFKKCVLPNNASMDIKVLHKDITIFMNHFVDLFKETEEEE